MCARVGRRFIFGAVITATIFFVNLLFGQLLTPAFGQTAASGSEQNHSGRSTDSSPEPDSKPVGAQSNAGVIDESQLVGLPMNGRSYSQLATLQSGVSDPSAGSASRGTGGGGLTVAGGRPISNNFLLDGTSIMDTDNQVPRSAAGVQLGSDSVLQVLVFSTAYGAEFGRGSGGVLNSITRSGTPNFHGTIFEYFRNSKLDARNFFDPGNSPTPFKRNQFGATITGPVRRSSTFFMASFEALRDRLSQTSVSYFLDQPARDGILTDSLGNIIRTLEVSSRVKPYLALQPVPNSERLGGGIGEDRQADYLPTNELFFVARVDHRFSDPDSVFVRYTFDNANSRGSQATYLFSTLAQSRQQFLTLVETHIFSVRSLNTVRLAFTRPVGRRDSLYRSAIPKELYFLPDAPHFGQISVPGLSTFGPDSSLPDSKVSNSYQAEDDGLLKGNNHTLKLGVEIHRYQWNVVGSFLKSATWSFNNIDSFLQAGPEGTTLQIALPGSDSNRGFRQTLYGIYFQDEYRANAELQIAAGIRYEFGTLVHEVQGKTSFIRDILHDSTAQVGPILPRNPMLNNIAPRLGITWAPSGSRTTRLSAGGGIYYDDILEYAMHQTRASVPYFLIKNRTNFDSSSIFPDAIAGVADRPYRLQVLDYNGFTNPYVIRYNAGWQQQFRSGWRVQASFVGARGNHLIRTTESNLFPVPVVSSNDSLFFPSNSGPLNPNFSSIQLLTSDVQSFYNSLQLSVAKTIGTKLSVQGSYTLSKSVDDSSNNNPPMGDSAPAQYSLLRTLDRGLSDYDVRHRVVINYFYALPAADLAAGIFRGWRIGGILNFRTGVPFTVQSNVRTPGYLFDANRPNIAADRSNNPTAGNSIGCSGVAMGEELGRRDLYFDPCVFSAASPGTLGTLGRNTLVAPSVLTMDVNLQREFSIDSQRRLQFRLEFFNLPNHTNFNRVTGSSTIVFSGAAASRNPVAGKISNTASTSRQLQFAVRLSF